SRRGLGTPAAGPSTHLGRRPAVSRQARISGWLLVAMAVLAIVVPLASPSDPLAIGDVLATRLLPPLRLDAGGHLHLLGTDRFGRDLLTRMMLAGRISLLIGVGGSLLAGALGTVVGLVAGWSGGAVDRLAMAVSDAMLSIPRLILLLLCAALWQPGIETVVVVLAATGWMGVGR